MKNKWLQTIAAWAWSNPMPETNVPIRDRKGNYKLFQMNVSRTEYPSNKATVTMHFWLGGRSASAYDPDDCEIFDEKIRSATGAVRDDRSLLGVRNKSFDLPSGEEFCDVAIRIAKALFAEFGIKDPDGKFIGRLKLCQTTFVRKGHEYVGLSQQLLDKHGLVKATHYFGDKPDEVRGTVIKVLDSEQALVRDVFGQEVVVVTEDESHEFTFGYIDDKESWIDGFVRGELPLPAFEGDEIIFKKDEHGQCYIGSVSLKKRDPRNIPAGT